MTVPRVGLGCMRVDDALAVEVIQAAWDAGVRHFDTAHAYGNQHLVARALGDRAATITSKGGMARPEGKWVPDGRASIVRTHALETAQALGRAPDVFLIHAPDSRVAWSTTVRALARLQEEGVVRAAGLANVTLAQLDEALELAPIREVQVALSVLDDSAVRSGVVARCLERGIRLVAHSPLGGVRQVEKLLRHTTLQAVAARLGSTPALVALAAVLDLHPSIEVIPGARRVATAASVVQAEALALDEAARLALRSAFPALAPLSARGAAPRAERAAARVDGEIVLVMGLQGAGKSARVGEWVSKGYKRLNRDELGTSLDDVAKKAALAVAQGTTRLVLDNTYVSRKSRAAIIDVAARAGLPVRGVWLDVPLHEAQVNVIWRMLEAHGRLLSPAELNRGDDNTSLPPMAQLRLLKTLEAPTLDEGFDALEVVPFVRVARGGAPAVFAAEGLLVPGAISFAWRPEGAASAELTCPHPGGPPACWCRPPLPGLLLAYAHQHRVDLTQSELHGTTDTHQVMAAVVGARFVRH